jgi:hypothetical protein
VRQIRRQVATARALLAAEEGGREQGQLYTLEV